jgi:hypothetical protein
VILVSCVDFIEKRSIVFAFDSMICYNRTGGSLYSGALRLRVLVAAL